ncbi:unnamed protein product [Linum trigynum]|uniref:Uncharacterized protein n=1 Tax=Linum trigynum TaxID=586398 RepID=A0AAV2FER9_9ROSI
MFLSPESESDPKSQLQSIASADEISASWLFYLRTHPANRPFLQRRRNLHRLALLFENPSCESTLLQIGDL